ncbi:Ms4527A family Cys-rich leader peptide [Mycobacteroides salmoniphilum]|uniref:Ms4527A family Cys-rich leader peptide n=2 Tax=Mycobacteriaceae TaxID=1762 RepID=UPI00398848C1
MYVDPERTPHRWHQGRQGGDGFGSHCSSVCQGRRQKKICAVNSGNPPRRMEVLLTMSGITTRSYGVPVSHGTIGRVSTHQVPLVARRHIDLKRVCSACCLP